VGDRLPERSWTHAPAAYMASLCQSRQLCRRIGPGFSTEGRSEWAFLGEDEREMRASLREGASWEPGETTVS
jgi:hypothetical protein